MPPMGAHGPGGRCAPEPTPTSSAPTWERAAMCAGCAGSTYKTTGTLERHQILLLASTSPLYSLAVRTPRSPPLPCARLPATRAPSGGMKTRVSWPPGPRGGCGSCGRWALARGKVTLASLARTSLGSRWRVSIDTVTPVIRPYDRCQSRSENNTKNLGSTTVASRPTNMRDTSCRDE